MKKESNLYAYLSVTGTKIGEDEPRRHKISCSLPESMNPEEMLSKVEPILSTLMLSWLDCDLSVYRSEELIIGDIIVKNSKRVYRKYIDNEPIREPVKDPADMTEEEFNAELEARIKARKEKARDL